MAGSFRIAEGYVEVTADESAYDQAMARLQGKKHTVNVGVQLDDKDALARLAKLTSDRVTKILADADTRVAADDLALLTRRRSVSVSANLDEGSALTQLADLARQRAVRILVEIDDTAALARLAELTRDRMVRVLADADTRTAADDLALLTRSRTARVTADADTAGARADLDILTRDRRMNVRVDMDRSALSMLSSIGGSGGGGGGAGLGILSSKIAQIAAAAIGALPTMASLGQSMVAMGPAAAIAAPAVLSLASAFAAIKIGTSGIGDAFKAAFAPAAKGASAALSATKAVENAQRSLVKAEQGVRDAEVNAAAARVAAARQIQDAQLNLKNTVSDVANANRRAAESVASAERNLADAQRAARQAQEDLTQARKDAAMELEDLNNRLTDAHLNERDAVLRVQDAQQNLDAVKAKGAAATQEERDKAQLEYDKAVQALKEQQTETQRLEQQAAAANKAGVEGSDKVTSAKQAIADATQNAADKAQALKDAEIEATRTQIDGAQKITKAERDLADARAAATKAAVDGARQIADAQAAVADAARAVAEAQQSAALKTGGLGQALAILSPQARAFVNAVIAQREAWRGLKLDVQDALFRGLGKTFTNLSNAVIPTLSTGLSGTAGILNTMAKNAASAVMNLAKTGALKKLFSGLNDGLKPLSKIPGQFITALAQIGIAASPAFKKLTTAAGDMATRISDQLTKAFKNGHLEKVIDGAIGIAKQFGHLIGDIFGTFANVFKAAAKGGGDALGSLGALFKELHRVTALPEVQKGLTAIFAAINAVAKLLAGTVGKVVVQLIEGFAKIAPAITTALNGLSNMGPLLGVILLRANPLIGVLALIAPILGKLAGPISGLVKSIAPLLQMLANFSSGVIQVLAPVIGSVIGVVAELFKALAPVMAKVLPMILQVVKSLAGPLTNVIKSLVPMIGPLVGIVTALSMAFLPLIPTILQLLPPIGQLVTSLLGLVTSVLTPMLPLIQLWAKVLTTEMGFAIGLLVPVINTVVGWLTKFVDAITAGVNWIVDKFKWLFDVLVGHSIIPDLVKAIISWFTSLWDHTKKIFTDLKNGIVNIWNTLWNGLRSRWDTFYTGIRNTINGARTWMRDTFNSIRTTLSDVWTSLWNGIRDRLSSILNTIRDRVGSFKSAMQTAFRTLRDSLGTIWNGLRNNIAAPVRFVVNTVYNNGIRKMWDTIASKVGLPQLPQIKLGFNKGGIVPGQGSGDTVPAMLTPGERILSNQQVAALGGHRGIDAMLGKDHPTGTGGNPTRSQERDRQQQPRQAFADGGIVGSLKDIGGTIAGAVGSGLGWVKDLVVGGLRKAAETAISSMIRPLINRIPGGGMGDLMRGMANKALSGILGFLGKEDNKAVGGPAVQKALSWARTQNGLPYQWAGNGNPSWDCSGLMSAIESVIRGESPHRRWATGSFSGATAPAGWVRNLTSPFMIGITNAGVGHTAGTIGGVNVESRGGDGVVIGRGARGYNDSLFTDRYGFEPATKFDTGGLLQPGATMAVNATKRPERILDADHTAKLDALLNGTSGGGGVTIQAVNIHGTFDFSSPASRKQAATAMVKEMNEALRQWNRGRAQ